MKGETLFLIAGIGVLVYLWTRPSATTPESIAPQSPVVAPSTLPALLMPTTTPLPPALNPQSPGYDPTAAYQYLAQFPRPIPQ